MNRHHLVPTSMRIWLVVSLLITFVSIEYSAAPPVAQAATPVSISAGGNHTCGLKSDATLACWGLNDSGQATPPAGTFTQISAGNYHTCGLKSDATVACWGYNEYGQATPPAGTFSQVSAGGFHTCGVKSDSTLACWGFSAFGQTTPPAGTFTQVSAGYRHTCGLKSDATLACWGLNDNGQATPPAGSFTQVSAGFSHSCGLKSDATVACWGLNANGQATPPAGTFTQIDAGANHNCGLKSNGTLACWGYNAFGQASPPAGSFTQLDTGANHACGLKTDGTGICWGLNLDGQAPGQLSISPTDLPTVNVGVLPPTLGGAGGLGGPYSFTVVSGTLPTGLTLNSNGSWAWNSPTGRGDYSFSIKATDKVGILGVVQQYTLHVVNTSTAITGDTPGPSAIGQAVPVQYAVTPLNAGIPTGNVTVVVVQQALRFVQVSMGFFHSCGLKADRTLACWGLDSDGQATPPAGTFTQVSAGASHSCGLKTDATVVCWGSNSDGQATPPTGTFTQLSAGSYHTCGLKSDGTVVCWGSNSDGQATPPAGTFTQVSAGGFYSCGLKSDGTVVCWGDNLYGQVTPPTGAFTQVSAGGFHACGLKTNGSLACWGDNPDGEATPPAGSFTLVSAGASHTCGVKSASNTLACWGSNSDGRATPPAGSFTQVSAAESHTCGVKTDGTVVCWGNNSSGQATPPDGTISNSPETCTAAVSAGGCAIVFTSVGLKYLRASYAGDGAFSASESALIAHSVKAATTTTIASITPGPAEAGPTVLVHYTVASTVLDIPSGMVTVTAGADSCTASASAGVCRLAFTSAGVKSLTASYTGDSGFNGSVSAAVAYTVKATTTTISSVTPSPAGAKRTVLVRYTVASTAQGIPSGVVTVRAGADSCTASAAAGACLLTFSSAGVKSLTASYASDSAFFGSVSDAVAYTVADQMVVFVPLIRR